MNKFILLLLFSHVSYTFAETSIITTEAYTTDAVPNNDLSCPGSLRRQAFQGNENYVCRINGVAQPEASHHSHVVNAFTEYRTQMVDFDTNNDKAKAPNLKHDACIKLADGTEHLLCAETYGTDNVDVNGTLKVGATTTPCTQATCAHFKKADNTPTAEWRAGREGVLDSHSGNIKQIDKNGVRSSADLDVYFRERFLKTKATLSVNVAQNEDQVYEGCDVQLHGTSLGDLKDYVEFIPNERALGACSPVDSTIKTLRECMQANPGNLATFIPKERDPQCSQETGKCDNSRKGAAEFRVEGMCTIAVGDKTTYNDGFCELADGTRSTTKTIATCNEAGDSWVVKEERLGYIETECGSCREVGTIGSCADTNGNKTNTARTTEESCEGPVTSWCAPVGTKANGYATQAACEGDGTNPGDCGENENQQCTWTTGKQNPADCGIADDEDCVWTPSPYIHEELTAKYTRKSDCDHAGKVWTPSTWAKNDDYSCVFYIANNKFVGETNVIVSFHKIPSTVGNGKAIHTISVPIGFSPHGTDKNFREAKALKIIDSELQNKYFRDVALDYKSHCEHAGNYFAPALKGATSWETNLDDTSCIAPNSYYSCSPGGDGGGGCSYSEAGTVNARLSATFIDTRYKTAAQNGVERLKKSIGDFLIVKSGLELHQDYRSFNDPSLNDFKKGNDGSIQLNPIKYDYKKTEDQWVLPGGAVFDRYSNVGTSLVGRCLGKQYGNDAIIKQSYCRHTGTYVEKAEGTCTGTPDEYCASAANKTKKGGNAAAHTTQALCEGGASGNPDDCEDVSGNKNCKWYSDPTTANCDATTCAATTDYEWTSCSGGECTDGTSATQTACLTAGESWTPYVWDDGYPALQQDIPAATSVDEGSLIDAYKCSVGSTALPTDLRDSARGNCYAQYSFLYTFSFTYGALPHFKSTYIGCPLCDNELVIKGFQEDTDGDGETDTYQINTKIPVSLKSTEDATSGLGQGLGSNNDATNEIVLPGLDFLQVSSAALLEPEMLQKFSFVFEAVEDPNNSLRLVDQQYASGEKFKDRLPTSLDDKINLQDLFNTRSLKKVIPTAATATSNQVCGYSGGVCANTATSVRIFGTHEETPCVDLGGSCGPKTGSIGGRCGPLGGTCVDDATKLTINSAITTESACNAAKTCGAGDGQCAWVYYYGATEHTNKADCEAAGNVCGPATGTCGPATGANIGVPAAECGPVNGFCADKNDQNERGGNASAYTTKAACDATENQACSNNDCCGSNGGNTCKWYDQAVTHATKSLCEAASDCGEEGTTQCAWTLGQGSAYTTKATCEGLGTCGADGFNAAGHTTKATCEAASDCGSDTNQPCVWTPTLICGKPHTGTLEECAWNQFAPGGTGNQACTWTAGAEEAFTTKAECEALDDGGSIQEICGLAPGSCNDDNQDNFDDCTGTYDHDGDGSSATPTAEIARVWTEGTVGDNGNAECQWNPINTWHNTGASGVVCAGTTQKGTISCDLGRNLCVQENTIAATTSTTAVAGTILDVFSYKVGDIDYYGCPALFKSVCVDGIPENECVAADNLKLFRLSADPAASLQALFESECKMYIPENGYGSTYYVEFENEYEATLGTCTWNLEQGSCSNSTITAIGDCNDPDVWTSDTRTYTDVPAALCDGSGDASKFPTDAGQTIATTNANGLGFVHVPYDREKDQIVTSTIKELKAGRFLRLEQTQLSLMQRLEVTNVYQRVATTVNFKISKNTVEDAGERTVFKIRGGSATLDGFTRNNPATQLSDECALGPKGQCTLPGTTIIVAGGLHEHLCGTCCKSSVTDFANCDTTEASYFLSKNQCQLRGFFWFGGDYIAPQPDISVGFAWKQHTVREYLCDTAGRDRGSCSDASKTTKETCLDEQGNTWDIKASPLFPCRILNGTCSGGDKNLGASETLCTTASNYMDKAVTPNKQMAVGVWHKDISSADADAGTCLMTFESCEQANNGQWTRVSDPLFDLVDNLKPSLITECQPDTLTDGRALQGETTLITAATNGESIEHSVRTTKECTGTVDLQFEDQTLGQDFAIYTSRVPCSRVSSSELKDEVNLKYHWKTSLDIALDTVTIDGRYAPIADIAGECEDDDGVEYITSTMGALCDNKDACENKGRYKSDAVEEDGTTPTPERDTGCERDSSSATWYNDYSVETFFGVCKNDNTINKKTPTTQIPAAADVVLNKAACTDDQNGYQFTQNQAAVASDDARFTLSKASGGLATLIDCAKTVYSAPVCCKNCFCKDSSDALVSTAEAQNEAGCLAAAATNVWVQGDVTSARAHKDYCGTCSVSTYTDKEACMAADVNNAWTVARNTGGGADADQLTNIYLVTTGFMVPSVETLSESYVITYSMAMSYTRRIRDNAFGGSSSNKASGDTGQVKYCQDQLFTATLRRDASASVVVAQVKAAELNRAVIVEDIRWIGSADVAISGIWGCNQGEFRLEVTFMVLDQDARYQERSDALDYWKPADLVAAMVDTAADAQNDNIMAIKTVVSGPDTFTVLRKPGLRCFDSNGDVATDSNGDVVKDTGTDNVKEEMCETDACATSCATASATLTDTDLAGLEGTDDNYHFKVMGVCVPVTQCLTNADDNESPIEEVPDGINGNSWADYSSMFVFDLVVRGKFLKSDVDTKIEVTSNFQECPVTASASVSGVPRIGVQLECFEPVSFAKSAIQWVEVVHDGNQLSSAEFDSDGLDVAGQETQKCIECHRIPVNYIKLKAEEGDNDHTDYGLYSLGDDAPSGGFCTDGVSADEESCTSPDNVNCGVVTGAKSKCMWVEYDSNNPHVCCPMDCGSAYADDLAQTRAKMFVTSDENDPLESDAYKIADTQGWSIESSEVFIERYDTSTVTATTGATLIGEVRLCVCPDPLNALSCKVDNSNPYGLTSFNTHSTVTQKCSNPSYTDETACVAASESWSDGIEEYFMACGRHTSVISENDNYGKGEGNDDNNIYVEGNSATDKSIGPNFDLAQINLMPLSEAPADEFRIRYDIILSTTQFNQRRRLRSSTVVRKGAAPKLGDINFGSSAETKGINILFRPANGVAPKQPSDSGEEESPKHDGDKSEPMEAGTVFLIVAAVLVGVGLMIWGSSLFMSGGESGTIEETTSLVGQVVENVVRKPRFENLRY